MTIPKSGKKSAEVAYSFLVKSRDSNNTDFCISMAGHFMNPGEF